MALLSFNQPRYRYSANKDLEFGVNPISAILLHKHRLASPVFSAPKDPQPIPTNRSAGSRDHRWGTSRHCLAAWQMAPLYSLSVGMFYAEYM